MNLVRRIGSQFGATGCVLVLCAVSPVSNGISAQVLGDASASTLSVHLRIDQTSGLSPSDLRCAIDQVHEIWRTVGVTVTSGRYGEMIQPRCCDHLHSPRRRTATADERLNSARLGDPWREQHDPARDVRLRPGCRQLAVGRGLQRPAAQPTSTGDSRSSRRPGDRARHRP